MRSWLVLAEVFMLTGSAALVPPMVSTTAIKESVREIVLVMAVVVCPLDVDDLIGVTVRMADRDEWSKSCLSGYSGECIYSPIAIDRGEYSRIKAMPVLISHQEYCYGPGAA